MTEHTEQIALFIWAAHMESQYPALECLFAIPNGGHRHPAVGAKMKAEGVKRGVLDVFLPVPCGIYHGLWIEMKFGKGRLSKEQKWWVRKMKEQGYRVAVCYSAETAQEAIMEYLNH